jgi:hypothetical protein
MMSRVPPTLSTYTIPLQVLEETGDLLREPGLHGFEAVVLWVGTVDDETSATVRAAVRPGQTAIRGDQGCGVEVPPDALSALISALPHGVFVLARLHTHPGEAYHSPVDDTNMLIAHEGALSIVVPDFARAPLDLRACSVNELRSASGWRELDVDEVDRRFLIS